MNSRVTSPGAPWSHPAFTGSIHATDSRLAHIRHACIAPTRKPSASVGPSCRRRRSVSCICLWRLAAIAAATSKSWRAPPDGGPMGQLFLIAFATFASEDLTCLATGALIAGGKLGLVPGVLACAAGIYFGDLLLYFAGRAGRPVVGRLVDDARVNRASAWLAARGAGVVLVSRFTPGLRLPTYVAAGLLKTRF